MPAAHPVIGKASLTGAEIQIVGSTLFTPEKEVKGETPKIIIRYSIDNSWV